MTEFPWGCDFYVRNGRMMDADGFDQLQQFDAIFLGAIGDPRVPDHVSVWELILPLRQRFDQYVNLRPMRLLPGVTTPLANRTTKDIDMICVRENSEGEYGGLGGRMHVGTPYEVAEQTGIFTRRGIERVARYAFEVASQRPRRKLAQRDEVERAAALDGAVGQGRRRGRRRTIPQVEWRKYHVDALAARMVTDPGSLDVILASNLFGDILTDLGAAVSGSLGVAPERATSTPIATSRRCSSRSTAPRPDIMGKGLANPIGAIWSGALMLSHLGHTRRARPHRARRSKRCSARAARERRISAGRRRRRKSPRRSRRRSDRGSGGSRLQAPGFRLQACEAPSKPEQALSL